MKKKQIAINKARNPIAKVLRGYRPIMVPDERFKHDKRLEEILRDKDMELWYGEGERES